MITKTFCVLPWLHAATRTNGDVQLCCVADATSGINLNEQTLSDYWTSEYVKDVRRRMLAGESVKACEYCYQKEAYGYKSHRLVENEAWQERCGAAEIQRLIGKTGGDGALDEPLQYIDLRLGNTCNMECVMCQPNESSRWSLAARKLSELAQAEELKNEWRARSLINRERFEWYRKGEFWASLKAFLPHVNEITLGGGEPFLITEQFAFVKACCEMGEAGHIRLRYHTNASIFSEELSPYWEQFERVHLFVSIDGIGDVANYVRYPTNWEQIQRNIAHFDGLGDNTVTNFQFTTHALNIYRIPEVFDWADRSGFRNRAYYNDLQEYVCVSLVHYPPNQSIRVLPADYKKIVTEKLRAYIETRLAGQRIDQLTAILDFMNAEDESDQMGALVEYTKMLDKMRGTNFFTTFPELAPYWLAYQQRQPRRKPLRKSWIGERGNTVPYFKKLWTRFARNS